MSLGRIIHQEEIFLQISLLLLPAPRVHYRQEQKRMIRIEGIPMVKARLIAAAQKARSTKARKTIHSRSEITKSGKAPALSSRMQARTKAA